MERLLDREKVLRNAIPPQFSNMKYHLLTNNVLRKNSHFTDVGHHDTFVTPQAVHLGTIGVRAPDRGILEYRLEWHLQHLRGGLVHVRAHLWVGNFKGKRRQQGCPVTVCSFTFYGMTL